MSYLYRCHVCDGESHWRLTREGDVVTSWACGEHMSAVCDLLQRDSEVTRLIVEHQAKLREVAEINRALRDIADADVEADPTP